MRMRPSRAEKMLAQAPEDWQKAGLQAMAAERARIARGEFTEEEKAGFAFVRKCGAAAGARVADLVMETITKEKGESNE